MTSDSTRTGFRLVIQLCHLLNSLNEAMHCLSWTEAVRVKGTECWIAEPHAMRALMLALGPGSPHGVMHYYHPPLTDVGPHGAMTDKMLLGVPLVYGMPGDGLRLVASTRCGSTITVSTINQERWPLTSCVIRDSE
jgi:hypothetical protein